MDISIDKELKQRDLIYKKAKAKNKDYTINDGDGLFMKITKDNKKLWHFRFTFNKKRFLTSFRSYPKVSLATARSKRNEYLSLLNQGINPIEYFRKEKENLELDKKGMFENVFNEWLIYESKKLAPPTFKTKKQIFISSVLPYLKNKHIKNITKNDLLRIIENKEKTAKETASRLIGYLIDLWSYAISRDYCEINHLKNIDKKYILKEKRTVTNYSKITDIPTFKELVNEIYSANNLFLSMQNLLKFSLHVPLRANNLCNLKWENINFENKTLTIPRNEMKVKNPNLNDFTLPLSDEVINILNNQRKWVEEVTINPKYVFIGVDLRNPIHRDSPTKALINLGFIEDKKQSLHSMRGSFKTILEEKDDEHNISHKIIKSTLDHTLDNKVGLAYSNKVSYLNRQKPLMDFWSNFILDLLN
ncbi:tyrosine-type recombinase/integrase [Aliarcobacter butzleri]|uniref:tyrosine-type recombinase/integrase n=1 Tax=Aliarcobacter butzleri TaxID=28197 RepID=UPI00263E8FB8|nr:site-specific integrase [Aliarcobacter butzleri]MDN5082618.1 integrase arm-type DNA-binding domain-containing protein [Aliarcobacter butzleri]MDN5084768.1 integrase arm-type DNA-binding domain-containing protein [Aliarcobacter butzleri]